MSHKLKKARRLLYLDLAVLDSVRDAAAEVLEKVPRIDALICNAAIAQVHRELEEAARVCGAGWSLTYWQVLLPLVSPVLITVAVLSFQAAVRGVPQKQPPPGYFL